MILDTTYFNPENKTIINDTVGSPIPVLKRLKMGGIGSKRMIIEEVSSDFKDLINKVADINYANIEIRPLGILVMINKGLKNYTWIVPFYRLAFYDTNGFSIHSSGKFIKFKKNKTHSENRQFFKKLAACKIEYDKLAGKNSLDTYTPH